MVTKSAKRVASFLGTSALTRPLFALGAASALLGAGQAQALDANTLPQNPNVVGGKDSFAQSGNTLNVNQSTKRTVIDWRSFDIGSKAQVNFNQPGTSAIAVNRVNSSANATQIEGGLHANGQVWILNPNGVFFGKGAHVDAAGIVASTANIDTNAFMAGSNKLQMTGADHGSVENQGNISVGANGLAAFVAPSVRNSGVINATVGKVALAAGTTYTLDLAGDHLVELGLGSVKAVVDNSGRIVNPGGTIALTAKAAGQVVSSVVNVSGVVSASSVSKSGGTITLGGDNINTTATAQLSADAGTNGNGGAITSVANNQGNYAGSFSAKGGSASGNGGSVETSGKSVTVADGISVDTRAPNGILGNWTVDPLDVTISSSGTGLTGSSISTGAIETALNTTDVTITTDQTGTDNGDLNLADSINASASTGSLTLTGRHLYETNASTINLGSGALTLNVNAVNPLADTTGGNWVQDAVNMIGTVTGGSTVHLGAGTYAGGTQIHASNVTLTGDTGAKIVALTNGVDGVEIFGNNVTVQNLEFAGPANQSFTTFAWGNDITRGIFVENGAQNFNITGNNIHGLRNDILVDGRNTGSITNNTIDNSKSGISVQYTDGTAYDKSLDSSNSPVINIAGNVQGAYGNEWGINYHLNGYWNGVAGDETHPNANPVMNGIYLANAPTLTWQQGMLAQSAANGGMSIQDQAYKTSNRTSVTVSTTGSDTHQGSVLSTLGTIQGGINAVVTGGTVNVLDGTYVIPSGGANYIEIQKALTLKGQSELGTIIDARNASTYGVRVQADNVNLSNFTVEAPTAAGSYGIKVEPLANVLPIDPNNRLRNFSIANVTSQGSGKTELDLNGVLGATIDHFTANGAPVGNPTGSTAGNGIALTDTANVVITNSVTENNQWGGLALYQTNNTYNQQTDNITVDGTNTFNEANPIYAEDQSASQGFGALHLTGFDYVVKSPTNPNDVYTWFQRTQQNAIDFAAAVAPTTGAVEGYAGDSVNGNNIFYVGYNTANTQALSINAAVNAAASGATINVADGTYNQNVTINKANLTLQSDDGRDATTIVGQGNTALGTILVQANNFTLGGTDHGFTVVGIDNASPGIESAAVYIQGNNSGSTIQNNRITANGDEALLTEYGATVSGLTVDNNIFDGQTFAGANPAGVGSSQQFTLANVPRQLVVISGGSGGGNTSNITFTNNQITGTTGGLNTSGQEQGNNLVTIDSHGATITGNTFAGKTDAWYDALRARGTDTTVTGNTFDGTNMGAGTNMLEINNSALVGSFTNLIANNVWNNGSAWVNHAIAGVNYVFRGIQNAITGATAGDTVNVGAGTYNEALNISKSLDIEGAGAGQTIIQPTTLLSTGVGHKYDSNVQTAVYVHDTSGVTLNGLTIDANNLGANAVVFWNNASGTISNSLIENPMAFSGAQTGQGLAVDATSGNTSDLTVSNVTFQNWNKNAIDAVTGDGSGANGGDIVLNVDHSTFTGAGDTGTIAQNGILLWEQGGGSVSATVDNSSFSDLSYNDPNTATATGILVYGSPNGSLTVSNSTFDSSVQEYISTAGGSPNEVDATQGNTFDGVTVSSATPLDDIFTIENKITDGTDDASNGLVRLVAGQVYATASKNNIQNAADVASNGDTVNVQDGSYTLAGEFDITKSLTLKGQSEGGVDITSNSTGYGINVTADNVSLQNFTYHGPTGTGSTYGIKVTPDTGVASDRLLNFDIENVTIDQGYRTGLDLNGVDGATIKNVSVSNIVHGNGIALTDSANVAITGSNTSNNAWGGLALYQTNAYHDQQVDNIVVDGSNSFNDTIPVYSEDQSASLDIGSVTLAGFDYVVQSPNHPNDVYSWFQKTQQAALDFATNGALSNNNVNVPTATVQGYSGSGVNGNNVFYVGTGTNSVAMSIAAANAAASNGATIDVLAGTYTLPSTLTIGKSLSLVGAGEGATTIDGSGMAFGNAMRVSADNVSLGGFTLETSVNGLNGISVLKSSGFDSNGHPLSGQGVKNFSIANVTINEHAAGFSGLTLTGVEGAAVNHVTVDNGGSGNAIQIADSANVVLTNNTTSNADFGFVIVQNGDATSERTTGVSADTSNTFGAALAPVSIIDVSTSGPGMGALDIEGFALAIGTPQHLELHNGLQGTIDRAAALDATNSFIEGWTGTGVNNTFTVGTSTGGTALSVNTAIGAASTGGIINVNTGTYGEDVSDAKQLAFNFGDVNVNSFTLASGGAGSSLNGNLTATGAIALNGSSTVAGNLSGGSIATTAPLTLIGNATSSGAVSFGGTTGVTGNVQGATIATTGPLTLVGNATASGGVTFGGVTSVTGNVKGSAITANNTLALNGSATASGAITANGAALLSGNLTGGSIALNGATTLTGNTTLDTSAANGAISTASVDGTTAGGQSLGINAGTGTVSLGDLGAATRLGAVSDASNTTLTGSTYNANSFLFGGDVTLTSADTTLNTTQSASAAGDITFQGDLFGTTDAAQSLTLIAGPGTGAASANGNITLQNAGTSAVYLNDLTVSGNDFTALTVDVGGDYNALLTGNQVFAADTLNVRGNASSIVGGDASGHIVAGGDVTIAAGGDISGTISGQNVNLTGDDVNSVVTATNAANIKGNTVEGSYTANTVTLIASNNVDAAVDATDFTLAANHGSVDGNWVTINTDGSNVVSVNGQTTVGLANVNPNQLVVEGFVLPAGTRIGANGQLILPQGVLLGLLSPGGGKPKMILVHSVQQLGELLAGGYSVIVIDLSNRDSGKPIQLASN